MAAPATHIILALRLPLLPEKNKQEFIIGTSFPDIRYLGVIEREKTHNNQATWKTIQQESSSFKAGMDFHALVDRMREDYMIEHNVYDKVSKSQRASQILKIFEDTLLYEKIDNWNEIACYFDTIHEEELRFDIKEYDIKRWHKILQDYLRKKPNESQLIKFYTHLKYDSKITRSLLGLIRTLANKFNVPMSLNKELQEIQGIFNQLESDPKLRTTIIDFYDNFPALLEEEHKTIMN